MKYICDTCNVVYNTEQEARECELKHKIKLKQAERIRKESEAKFAELQEAVEKFNETYGTHLKIVDMKIVDKYGFFFW